MDPELACEFSLRCAMVGWDLDSDDHRGISLS